MMLDLLFPPSADSGLGLEPDLPSTLGTTVDTTELTTAKEAESKVSLFPLYCAVFIPQHSREGDLIKVSL